MGVVVTAAASSRRLLTSQEAHIELGVAWGSEQDYLIDTLLDRASAAIEDECGRVFAKETVTETLAGSGGPLLGLSRYPIVDIASLTEDGVALAEGTDAEDYALEDAGRGILYRENGWPRGVSRGWDAIAYTSDYLRPGYAGLRYIVTYTAGYLLPGLAPTDPDDGTPALPGPVKQACLEAVRAWLPAQTSAGVGIPSGGITELRVDDIAVKYGGASTAVSARPLSTLALPPIALDLLRAYRRSVL